MGTRHLHSLLTVVHRILSQRKTRRTWARFRARPRGPVSAPLQHGLRFFRHLKPAHRSVHLTADPLSGASISQLQGCRRPWYQQEMYGVSTFRPRSMCGGRYLLSTGRCDVHEAAALKPLSDLLAFWPEPVPRRDSHFSSLPITIFITGSHVFTIPTALPSPGLWLPGGRLPRGWPPSQLRASVRCPGRSLFRPVGSPGGTGGLLIGLSFSFLNGRQLQ